MAQVTFTYKYSIEVQNIPNCPASGMQNIQAAPIVAYRFCSSDLNELNNRLPAARLTPSRELKGTPITTICSAFALSMYDSLGNLTNKARSALKSNPQYLKRIGDHYIEVRITQADGKCTIPNTSGHFDFFEYQGFNIITAIISHQVLPI